MPGAGLPTENYCIGSGGFESSQRQSFSAHTSETSTRLIAWVAVLAAWQCCSDPARDTRLPLLKQAGVLGINPVEREHEPRERREDEHAAHVTDSTKRARR